MRVVLGGRQTIWGYGAMVATTYWIELLPNDSDKLNATCRFRWALYNLRVWVHGHNHVLDRVAAIMMKTRKTARILHVIVELMYEEGYGDVLYGAPMCRCCRLNCILTFVVEICEPSKCKSNHVYYSRHNRCATQSTPRTFKWQPAVRWPDRRLALDACLHYLRSSSST